MKSVAGLKVLDNGGRQATGMMRPYQKVGVAVRRGRRGGGACGEFEAVLGVRPAPEKTHERSMLLTFDVI